MRWYVLYCWVNAGLNWALAAAALWMLREWRRFIPDLAEQDLFELPIVLGCWCAFALGLVFGAVNVVLPSWRRGAAWPAHIVNIVLGAGTVVLAPICVPLLFAYLDDEVKQYYGGV